MADGSWLIAKGIELRTKGFGLRAKIALQSYW